MEAEVFNRYETKYLIDRKTCGSLTKALARYTEPDIHSADGGFYTIRNIYYDTEDNSLIRSSLDKPVYKEKLRLRSYGCSADTYLEIKKKFNGIVNKRRCILTPDEAEALIKSHIRPEPSVHINTQVLNELCYFTSLYALSPKVYIAYDRQAFFGREDKDLRITFDKSIRTRRCNVSLEKGDYGAPLLSEDIRLMEIKCSTALPVWLTELLAENGIFKTAFSKYGAEYLHFIKESEELSYA